MGSSVLNEWLEGAKEEIQFLLKNNLDIRGQKILDVGCATGNFIVAARHAGAAESWGVDYNRHIREEMCATSLLDEIDKEHYLYSPFSKILDTHPELKGTFDIVKITAVTPYADAHEMRHMMQTAHALLKKNGKLLLGLPFWNQMGEMFKQDQENIKPVGEILAENNIHLARRTVETTPKLRLAYRRLVNAYFSDVLEFKDSIGHSFLLAGSPKEKVPEISQINFSEHTLRLADLPGEKHGTFRQSEGDWLKNNSSKCR